MKKRILSLILIFATITGNVAAFGSNVSDVGVRELPDTSIFNDQSGTYFGTAEEYTQWLLEGTPQVLVENMLKNNVAFTVDSDKFWNKTEKQPLSKTAAFNDEGTMLVPTDAVNSALGISLTGEYATQKQIEAGLKGWKIFTDPRGFMLISQNLESVINKEPAIEGDIGWKHYRSYYDVQAAMNFIDWEEVNPTEEDWNIARQRIYSALTIGDGAVGDEYVNTFIAEEVDKVKAYIDNLTISEGNQLPFSDATLYQSFQRAIDMARVYAMLRDKGRNDIDKNILKDKTIGVFNFLADNYMNKNISLDSNWFYNRITYPMSMAEVMILMYDEISEQRRNEVLADLMIRIGSNLGSTNQVPFKYYTNGESGVPTNSYSNYSNLLWETSVNYLVFVLAENTERINDCLMMAGGIFETVRNSSELNVPMIKDGVYEDGSFVFHNWYAYNTGYGYSYTGVIGPMVAMTYGTVFDVQKLRGFSNIYKWIEKSWVPFIYANARTKITSGREEAQDLSGKGNVMVKSLLLMSKYLHDEEGKKTIERLFKPFIVDYYDDYTSYERIPIVYYYTHAAMNSELFEYMEQIKNSNVSTDIRPYNYIYYNMDKVVHKRNDYTFMLSMSSERIDKYEAINNKGYGDWYISDGMTYLLQDKKNGILEWWKQIDRYCIPGTTVDSQIRNSKLSSYGTVMPNNTWAGGASDGMIAAAAMQLPTVSANKTSYVTGTKSYFMLDDKIICMGTGVSGGEGDVYTVVENYVAHERAPEGVDGIYISGYTDVSIDGEALPYEFDNKFSYTNPKYISLNNDRGWYFFGDNDVTVERVVNTKGFTGMSKESSNNKTPFITIRAEHGSSPNNDTYGYVILPASTKEEIAEYASNPDFEVIEQTNDKHIIRLYDGTIMANLFKPATLEGFTFSNPCSVIMKPQGKGRVIHIAEPTQKFDKIMVTIPDGGTAAGANMTVNNNVVTVDAGHNYGDTYMITYAPEGSEGLIWSAENYFSGSTPEINTWNVKLNIGIAPISTKLYAVSKLNSEISYKIANRDEISGSVFIKNNRLYYIPPTNAVEKEEIIIGVEDTLGNTAQYMITILMEK